MSPLKTLRSSFSLKLAASFLIVIAIIAGIGGIIYTQTGTALQDRTEAEMIQSTELQANTLEEWVERTRDTTRHLSGSEPVASGDEDRIADYLRTEAESTPDSVAAIHYYDTAEHEVLASTADDPETDYADVEWANDDALDLEDARATSLTRPYVDPTTGADAVAFVSAVPGSADRAIVVVVDLEAQTGALERPSTADGSFTHVVDSRGTVVMSHHTDDINGQNMGHEGEHGVESMGVERGLEGETGYVEMEIEHGHEGTMTMGYAPVEGTDWVIMTHVPADSAYALQDEIERSVIALVVLSILGLGVVGIVVGRNTTRSLGRLEQQAKKLENGDLDAELETGRIDEIGRLYDSFDSMRVSLRDRIQEVEEARNRADRLNRHLELKADEYSRVMRECADGDLTRRMDPESENEAMAEIAVEFNEMMEDIEETIERLALFAADVAASSEEVTASTEEVESASVEVAESIQEIADGAEYQDDRLQSAAEEMNGLSTTVEEIAASSNEVADLAEQTARTGREGQEAARAAIEGMNEIEAESERAVAEIEALQDNIEQIDELVEFISEVAEQTNMLALNANIEAARTVESSGDEGFGVVANEVKNLAAETREAAEDIEGLMDDIESQTDRTAEEVRTTSREVAQHRNAVEEAADALEEIAAHAAETNDGVQEISAATEQQAASTQQIVAMVDEAASISEATAAEAEAAAAAGEEQTNALSEVTTEVSTLSERAVRLSEELDEFETSPSIDVDRDRPVGELVDPDRDVPEVGDAWDVAEDGSAGNEADAGESTPEPDDRVREADADDSGRDDGPIADPDDPGAGGATEEPAEGQIDEEATPMGGAVARDADRDPTDDAADDVFSFVESEPESTESGDAEPGDAERSSDAPAED